MSSNPKLFLIKNDQEEEEDLTNFNIVKSTKSLEGSSNSQNSSQNKKEENSDNQRKNPSAEQGHQEDREPPKPPKAQDEEDGFRTPTSLDHKISVLTCPPPPKKMKQSLKRRAEPYNDQCCSCRKLPLNLANEVESLFTTQHIPFSDSYRAKKIRRGDQKPK